MKNNEGNGKQLIDEKVSTDLIKLITRLESVTNRLEQHAAASSQLSSSRGSGSGASTVATEAAPAAPTVAEAPLPASVVAFDDLVNTTFASFKQLTDKLGGSDVKSIVELVERLIKYERSFLVEAARCVQPSQEVLMKFYQQFSKRLEEVTALREKSRTSPLFNHLSAVSESISAFAWISISPAPSPFVKEMSDSAQFYTNRVLKDYKDKDQAHVNWVKLWLQLLAELQAYVKQHHTTGVAWNSAKQSAQFDPSALDAPTPKSAPAPSPKAPAGPPPPPPPPPMPNFADLLASDSGKKPAAAAAAAAVNTDALFAALNKGSDITKSLRQVSDAEKTHKNPALRGAGKVPGEVVAAGSVKTAAAAAPAVAKPPVFELVDKKWKVEYQTKRSDLLIDQTDLKHTVYIYKCSECTVVVKGKVNSILLDSCTRVALLFDDVLSTIEFINSRNVQMQVLGRVPTVVIEKTDGCQVYLSATSLDTEIVSSKSSAMNVLVPSADGEFSEQPVHEQFKTYVCPKTRKLITTPTEVV